MRKISNLIWIAVFMLGVSACEYTDIIPDDGSSVIVGEDVSFATDVEPIFTAQSCVNCHPGLKQPDLKPGKAYKSLTDGGYINTSSPAESMIYTIPAPGSSHAKVLTVAQQKIILAWIEQGAKDN